MATLLDSTFVGTDGDPWPSPWTHSFPNGSTGGTVALLSNRGRLRAHDGEYTTVRADAAGVTATDVLIEATVRFPDETEQYPHIWARSSGVWDDTQPWYQTSGYYFYMGPGSGTDNDIVIEKVVDGSKVDIGGGATISGTFQANVDYRIKFELDGTALRGKMWLSTDTEPAWQIETTDSDYSSGGIATSLLSGATGDAREIQYDSFAVNEIVTAVGASEWTNWVEVTTDADPNILAIPTVTEVSLEPFRGADGVSADIALVANWEAVADAEKYTREVEVLDTNDGTTWLPDSSFSTSFTSMTYNVDWENTYRFRVRATSTTITDSDWTAWFEVTSPVEPQGMYRQNGVWVANLGKKLRRAGSWV